MNKIFLKAKLIFIPCQGNDYRPKFLESRFLFYYLIGLLVLKLVIVPFLICFPKTVFFADLTQTALIQLTNQERQSSGVGILKESDILDQAALMKAQDILGKDYFAHYSPEGISPWYWFGKAGYEYQAAGENLAIGFLDSKEVHQAWMESPSHQKNVLNPRYEEIGIAVTKGDFKGRETVVVVQLFGVPKVMAAAIPEEVEEVTGEEPEEVVLEAEPVVEPEVVAEETFPEEKLLAEEIANQTLAFNFFSFLALDYYDIVQKIVYGSLIFVILALLINIFIRIRTQHRPLILRAVACILVLALFSIIDKALIIQFIPHEFSIYGF